MWLAGAKPDISAIPVEWQQFIEKCWAKDPAERLTAAEALTQIKELPTYN
jgi:hypothetical protein